MGFRFRKSINMGPFRVNLSKSGIGYSVGGKGARYTKTANGKTRTTLNIPGTGLSYVEEKSNKQLTKQKGNGDMTYTTAISAAQTANKKYSLMEDLQILDIPMKRKLNKKEVVFWIWFAIMFISPEIMALSLPFIVPFGIYLYVKRSCWRKKFRMLKIPVSYEDWEIDSTPSLSRFIEKDLTAEQIIAYSNILEFCDFGEDTEKVFNLNELNTTQNTTISNYMMNKLYDLGFLIKPERGKFALNPDRVEEINTKFDEYAIAKKNRYEAFVQECENYNNEVKKYNFTIIEKRLKNL